MKKYLIAICLFAGICAGATAKSPNLDIIPEPAHTSLKRGYFKIAGASFRLDPSLDSLTVDAVSAFSKALSACSGAGRRKEILFLCDSQMSSEQYSIDVGRRRIVVRAANHSGFFYALCTLSQMLPAEFFSGGPVPGAKWRIPCCRIEDAPRFAYRGLMLDVARHFFDANQVKRYLRIAALYKINRFHWHLTDDQGWRVEIKKYPLLTEIGSCRSGTQQTRDKTENDGIPYGGFYTQDEIRDIVSYAGRLGITIVPEIDLPGHMMGAMAAYPWLGCSGGPYEVRPQWGICQQVLCPGKESTFKFLFDVLDEICDLFPGEYIHMGGDECPKKEWEKCPRCQAKMKALGLVSDSEGTRGQKLQNYVTARVQGYLASKGRKIIGWDEILEGDLSEGATVMSWRGAKGGKKAASLGFDVIMSPNTYCYFDYKYTTEPEPGREFVGYKPAGLTAEKVYSFDPYEDLDGEAQKHILGVQANMWTEYLRNENEIYPFLFPRLQAISEVQWSSSENRDYSQFERKLREKHFAIMDALGYGYRAL
ncbi:MAG: beta-N-acetylhexosaminidase [Bacteroidales bacterium]|nr:beta-N-acetylhexosaminidase [Bacteroidales bacterium]